MVENANSMPAKASGIGNQLIWVWNAADVMAIPVASPAKPGYATAVVPMTMAVIVQITMVSMNGSSRETIPSVTGSI